MKDTRYSMTAAEGKIGACACAATNEGCALVHVLQQGKGRHMCATALAKLIVQQLQRRTQESRKKWA
eukprot:scaffold21321_cov18-Tisochrysis_lutea.AAC.1